MTWGDISRTEMAEYGMAALGALVEQRGGSITLDRSMIEDSTARLTFWWSPDGASVTISTTPPTRQ